MTILGLNSPEIFLLLVIALVILGTKRIEKGLNLFSRLIKFLLSDQNSFDKIDINEESIKDKEGTQEKEEEKTKIGEVDNAKELEPIKDKEGTQEKEEEKTKIGEVDNAKELEPIKDKEETQDKEIRKEKRIKIVNLENKGNNSTQINDLKEIGKDKTVKKLKTKNPKKIVKDKPVRNSKKLNVQDEKQDK